MQVEEKSISFIILEIVLEQFTYCVALEKMLQTELSVPKVHYDTAENELSEVEISTILMNW